jgi:hypothetical protein
MGLSCSHLTRPLVHGKLILVFPCILFIETGGLGFVQLVDRIQIFFAASLFLQRLRGLHATFRSDSFGRWCLGKDGVTIEA